VVFRKETPIPLKEGGINYKSGNKEMRESSAIGPRDEEEELHRKKNNRRKEEVTLIFRRRASRLEPQELPVVYLEKCQSGKEKKPISRGPRRGAQSQF